MNEAMPREIKITKNDNDSRRTYTLEVWHDEYTSTTMSLTVTELVLIKHLVEELFGLNEK